MIKVYPVSEELGTREGFYGGKALFQEEKFFKIFDLFFRVKLTKVNLSFLKW